MSIGYAKNQLTSVNVALESLRGDRALWVKPGDFLGHRPGVRAHAPAAIERSELKPAIEVLSAVGQVRVAAVALVARTRHVARLATAIVRVMVCADIG
jgi:hypothetical protein